MKIVITHDERELGIVKDFSNSNKGLIGQFITELEIIKLELIELYEDEE